MANIFFSYSHKDEELRNELEVHLAMLKREGLINSWHDRRIGAGEDIHSNISEELENADIVLLLVSANFLASDYCYDKEMKRALDKNQEGSTRVIPVIIHPCDWTSSAFGSLRATPLDGKPISMFANQAEALTQVAKDIRSVVDELGLTKTDDSQVEDIMIPVEIRPRSSNLRVKKKFTDKEVDDFLEASFEYVSRYFEASLEELQIRNPNITAKFRKVDANSFTASIYDDGARVSDCTIWMGGDSFVGGIAYCSGITNSRNQYNESISVENDGYTLHLRSSGMMFYGTQKGELSQEGVSELLWGMLVERLQ